MGIVVVKWEAFLRLTKSLPGAAAGSNFDDGWLFAADREAEYISVVFPWRDYEAWLASARELVRGLSDDSCTVSETRWHTGRPGGPVVPSCTVPGPGLRARVPLPT